MPKNMRHPIASASRAATGLPPALFFSTPQQRLALARERYFAQGIVPARGTISEAVRLSWERCLGASQDPQRAPAFNHVTPRLVRATLRFNRSLIEAARDAMQALQTTLAGTGVVAVLTDAGGVVVDSTFTQAQAGQAVLPLATRVGIDLSEGAAGTCAPAITAQTAQACIVRGAEHFYASAGAMYCAAAPVHNVHGKLAGILNFFSEHQPFHFDAASIVGTYANAVENRLLRAQSGEHLLVQMALSPFVLDTPAEGLAGIDSDGSIAWLNDDAARLLGVPRRQAATPLAAAEAIFEFDADKLLALSRQTEPTHLRLPSGLGVWVRSRAPQSTGARLRQDALACDTGAAQPDTAATAGTTPAATLRDTDRQLIAQTLQACGGNISLCARQLGVSRGRIYRHLQSEKALTPA